MINKLNHGKVNGDSEELHALTEDMIPRTYDD